MGEKLIHFMQTYKRSIAITGVVVPILSCIVGYYTLATSTENIGTLITVAPNYSLRIGANPAHEFKGELYSGQAYISFRDFYGEGFDLISPIPQPGATNPYGPIYNEVSK
jgi:hypothetical protein